MNGKSFSASIIHDTPFSKKIVFKGILLCLAFLFAYSSAIPMLLKTWQRSDYSHGVLVPFISLYLIWNDRHRLKNIFITHNYPLGFFLFAFGSIGLMFGQISSVMVVQESSILFLISGIVLILLGPQYFIALLIPIAYLAFMVPFFDLFVEKIQWPLQLLTAKLATSALSMMSIPVFLQDQFIQLPSITLEVADVCSGTNYLISILAIAIPLSIFTQKVLWRRILLCVLAVIIGIFSNGLRVALIGLWAYFGGKVVHGPFHIFKGVFVLVVGYIVLFTAAGILAKLPYLNRGDSPGKKNDQPSQSGLVVNVKKFNLAWMVSMGLLLGLGTYSYVFKIQPVYLKNELTKLPFEIGTWKGQDIVPFNEPLRIPGADSEITRIYKNNNGGEIMLYVGYYQSQRQDKEIINDELRYLQNFGQEIKINVNAEDSVLINQSELRYKYRRDDGSVFGEQKFQALFWYNLNGKIVANPKMAKFFTALDGIIHHRNNGAIVIVFSKLDQFKEAGNVLKNETEFVSGIIPILSRNLE